MIDSYDNYIFKKVLKFKQSAIRADNVLNYKPLNKQAEIRALLQKEHIPNYSCYRFNKNVFVIGFSKIKCNLPFLAIRNMGKAMIPHYDFRTYYDNGVKVKRFFVRDCKIDKLCFITNIKYL